MRAFMVIVLATGRSTSSRPSRSTCSAGRCRKRAACSGYFFPGLVTSEMLHYGYALVMLAGLWALRPGFTGKQDRRWWTIALGIQFFHHIEHALLQAQVLLGHNLFGRPVPTSIAQLWVPRVELHLFYNTIVFIPMIVAMYYHMFPPAEAGRPSCTCAAHRRLSPVV